MLQIVWLPLVRTEQCNVPTIPGQPPQTNGNFCDPCRFVQLIRLPGTRPPPPGAPPLPVCTWAPIPPSNETTDTQISVSTPATPSPTTLVIVQETPTLTTAIIALCSVFGLAMLAIVLFVFYKKTKKPPTDKPKIVVVDPIEPGMNYNNFA